MEANENIAYNLDIFEQFEKKIYEMRQIIEISKSIGSTLNYDTLIDTILLNCMGQMQVFEAAIFLPKIEDFENQDLYLHTVKGFDLTEKLKSLKIEENDPLIEYLYHNHQCILFDKLKENKEFQKSYEVLKQLNTEIVVPMRSKNRINGIITLGKRITGEKFSDAKNYFLITIGTLAGQAVDNARLYEIATVDKLTRLKMRHVFDTSLLSATINARKTGKSLSLIITDIDHFKNFNDTYGHQLGDKVLSEVAQVLKNSIREKDIACRYGGEEFTVIFIDTEKHTVNEIAERIRKNVEEHKVMSNSGPLNVTISIGIAHYDPTIDKTPRELIERADQALYYAKEHGRNRTVQYEEIQQ